MVHNSYTRCVVGVAALNINGSRECQKFSQSSHSSVFRASDRVGKSGIFVSKKTNLFLHLQLLVVAFHHKLACLFRPYPCYYRNANQ